MNDSSKVVSVLMVLEIYIGAVSPRGLAVFQHDDDSYRQSRSNLDRYHYLPSRNLWSSACISVMKNFAMGAMLRSDPMVLCHIYLQPETAFDVLSNLGEMSCAEFIDLNSKEQAFTRNYIKEVCRCAEMERQLRFMYGEMLRDNIPIADIHGPAKALLTSEMMFHENLFEKWENDISAVSENLNTIMKTYMDLKELQYVLDYIGPMLGSADIKVPSFKAAGDQGGAGQLLVTTGVVMRKRCFSFEMMLWRVSRGNMFYRQASDDKVFEDPYTGEAIRKVAFLSVCQGTQLGARLNKVYTGYGTTLYYCPETLAERETLINRLNERLWDMEQVISNSKYLRCKALLTVAKNWRKWMAQVRKAKAIYHTFGYCYKDVTKECLIGQCWIPEADVPKVINLLARSTEKTGANVPSFLSRVGTDLTPPTFQRTNKFTNGFQVLINSYGISQYRELNPGLYTIITFPFLFAMMFGDAGHAVILIMFSSWMIRHEKDYMGKPIANEIWKIFFGGRYVILLLGLFSINAGLVYNDWFGKAVCHVPSYWKCQNLTVSNVEERQFLDIDPSGTLGRPYPFGLDPIWSISSNKILMQNSIKMKLSIIIGVIHMMFGLCLSFVNYLHFKKTYAIILQFIPEIMFLCCFFLWLVILMYFKWFTYSGQHPEIERNAPCAPQILLLFIDMVLLSESKPPAERCLAYMFENQRSVQNILLLVGLLCIPVLLIGTPIFIYFRDYRGKGNKRKGINAKTTSSQFRRYQRSSQDAVEGLQMKQNKQYSEQISEEHEQEAFSEVLIHQAIHTIEFVLSTISHTASYLRLWALSLAHAQLSEMLWEMVLSKLALQDTSMMGVPKLFIIFSMWAFFTLSILVVMEGLSAFLHTLRLHWVEFMSKFYSGGGTQFRPLSFRILLETDSDKMDSGCKKMGKHDD